LNKIKNLNLDIDAIEQDDNSAASAALNSLKFVGPDDKSKNTSAQPSPQKDLGKARILVGISKIIQSEEKKFEYQNDENAASEDENHVS
jgi:hypothetical protein